MREDKFEKILIFSILIFFTSCEGEINEKNRLRSNESDLKKFINSKNEVGNFCDYGKWKIDSVAENNIVIDRLNNLKDQQIFNFRKNGFFSVMNVTDRVTSDNVIGRWEVVSNKMLIFNKNGDLVMKYSLEVNDSKLMILISDFEISSTNDNNSTFYLSRYNEY